MACRGHGVAYGERNRLVVGSDTSAEAGTPGQARTAGGTTARQARGLACLARGS